MFSTNRTASAVGTLAYAAAILAALVAWMSWRGDFETRADRAVAGYQNRIDNHLLALAGLAGFVAEQPNVDRRQWQAYLGGIEGWSNLSAAQGVGLAMRYDRSTKAKVADRLLQYDIARTPWPELLGAEGFAIVLLEPSSGRNRAALGFDMYSEVERNRAMKRARETRRPASTRPVVLKQEISGPVQPGFLIYFPVASRMTREVDHFVYAPYRAGDFFRDILRQTVAQGLLVEVRAPNGALMVSSGSGGTSPMERKLVIADQEYRVRISNAGLPTAPILVGFFGFVLATALTWLAFAQTKRLQLANALASAQADSEQHAQLLMREMTHRLKNAFARIAAIAHLTGQEKGTSPDFLPTFLSRLEALARSKEALIDPKRESGSFAELFRNELAVTGYGPEHGQVTGSLRLNEGEFYPMTLCVHELVTNSIKYGALRDGGVIHCKVGEDVGRCFVEWRESFKAAPNPPTSGFGTEFITTLLKRQMKADFERKIDTNQLHLRIAWIRAAPPA